MRQPLASPLLVNWFTVSTVLRCPKTVKEFLRWSSCGEFQKSTLRFRRNSRKNSSHLTLPQVQVPVHASLSKPGTSLNPTWSQEEKTTWLTWPQKSWKPVHPQCRQKQGSPVTQIVVEETWRQQIVTCLDANDESNLALLHEPSMQTMKFPAEANVHLTPFHVVCCHHHVPLKNSRLQLRGFEGLLSAPRNQTSQNFQWQTLGLPAPNQSPAWQKSHWRLTQVLRHDNHSYWRSIHLFEHKYLHGTVLFTSPANHGDKQKVCLNLSFKFVFSKPSSVVSYTFCLDAMTTVCMKCRVTLGSMNL